jgi:hypothetical protein
VDWTTGLEHWTGILDSVRVSSSGGGGGEASLPKHPASPPKEKRERGRKEKKGESERKRKKGRERRGERKGGRGEYMYTLYI